jgi:hypothetical protein
MSECDLCNQDRELIEGVFMKRSSSGGPVMLCDSCWTLLARPRCALCGTKELPDCGHRQHSVAELKEDGRGGAVCDDCRNILDWNH